MRFNRLHFTLISLSLILWVVALQPGAQTTDESSDLRVLFIGNSYTYYNDLPNMVEWLVRSQGHAIRVHSVAQPGWRLLQHAQSDATLETIRQGRWTHIVLQEQSLIPSIIAARSQASVPAIQILAPAIEANGAQAVMFMTWGYRDGAPNVGHANYESMQAALENGYLQLANMADAIIVPVGTTWRGVLAEAPRMPLWDSDGSHPSPVGTYLAACVFYAVLTGESPEDLPGPRVISSENANVIKRTAAAVVFGQAERWHLGEAAVAPAAPSTE